VTAPRLTLAGLLALLLLGAPARAQAPPQVSAPSALVIEGSTQDVAYRKAADSRHSIASATKLMTALLALERAKLSDELRAVRYRALPVESKIDLRPGERMTVGDLLRGLLLESANDAAVTLAERISGSRAAFVRDMNQRAAELGLRQTHFANPIGLDAPGNHSSARDLARLTLRLRAFDFFRRTVARPVVTLRSGDRPRTIDNRNRLVRLATITGVKTGHTQGAGYVLVGSGRKRGITLITVVLGAPSERARENDTLRLMEWAFRRYRRVRPIPPGTVLARVPIRFRRGAELALVPQRTSRRFVVRTGSRLRQCGLDAPAEVSGPIRRGERLGSVHVCRGERRLVTIPLVADAAVPEAGVAQRTKDAFTRPWALLAAALAALGGTVLLARSRRRGSNGGRRPRGEPEAA
jgi:D-alanyl-D-alanine carboxypeptidase (penicillin-binding protein 5/6)